MLWYRPTNMTFLFEHNIPGRHDDIQIYTSYDAFVLTFSKP